MLDFLAYITWDPNRFIFTIPIINHPVAWYGLWFVTGFIAGFFIIVPIFKKKLLETKQILPRDVANWEALEEDLEKISHPSPDRKSTLKVVNSLQLRRDELEKLLPNGLNKIRDLAVGLSDRLIWSVIIGTVIGARLGHVIFYDWPRYQDNLLDIFKVWEGGLASHGGAIGILIALGIYIKRVKKTYPELNFMIVLDYMCIPTALAASCIRMGNFFNQEILGPVTNVPWAIIFGHPYDGAPPLPRHPTQLYEAITYLFVFGILFSMWKKWGNQLKQGTIAGTFLLLIFGSRFFLEFLKLPSSLVFNETTLLTSQYLSIPFILLGLAFLAVPRLRSTT